MRYSGQPNMVSDTNDGLVGVLLTNLGTPEAPTAKALRPYLSEFLSDTRVIERSKWIWLPILHGIVLRVRPATSAKLYKRLWTDSGSPLMQNSLSQAQKLSDKFTAEMPKTVRVKSAMRYGKPSIDSVLQEFQDEGISRIIVLPLYPQYCAATVGSTFDAVSQSLRAWRWVPQLNFIHSYFDRDDYISALQKTVEAHFDKHGRPQKLLLSYHGMPQQYIDSGDPYYIQCQKTTQLLAQKMGLAEDDFMTCFQSRFGRAKWLEPSTSDSLVELAESNITNVAVICPGFSADCLETIDEIGEENKELFIEAGGKEYHYIPALNDSDDHIQMMYNLTCTHLAE